MLLRTGETIAGYCIEGVLGRGGMGVVYEARQLSLDRTVALKVLSPELSSDEGFRSRFRREGLIQARIDHPNIVPVYEAGEHDGALFLAMRLVRGGTLKDVVMSRELSSVRTLQLLGPVADALDAAHEVGLIHRDIKPQNILVGARDHTFLADFGLTRSGDRDSSLTRTGQWVGTPDYMAPEQIRGEALTPAADIYALAAVLFECLTGDVPYPKESDAAVLWAHMTDPPPRISALRADLPRELDDVLAQAMAKAPHERFAAATALLAAVGAALRGQTVVEPAAGARGMATEVAGPTIVEPAGETMVEPTGETVVELTGETVVEPAGETVVEPAAAALDEVAVAEALDEVAVEEAAPAAAAVASPPAPAPSRRSGPRRRAAALGLLVVAGAGVGAFFIGHSGSTTRPQAPTRVASAGDLDVRLPPGWIAGGAGLKPADVGLPEATAFHDPLGAEVLVAQPAADGASVVPAKLAGQLVGAPGQPERVRLGDLVALRYRALRLRQPGRPLVLYATPTTVGVATLACVGPAGTSTAPTDCDAIAASMRLKRGSAAALSPDPRYAERVQALLADFARDRATALTALKAARTPTGQASRATALAVPYATAATALGALTPAAADADAHRGVAAALDAGEKAVRRLASAAGDNDRADYAAAVEAVGDADAALRTALAALGQNGYRIV